ncbi:hypothetical protein [Cellvibrio fontiphilus]|uniref:ThuA-like domain-containing protein n=1 Tax=Cellvibrio fontiphilus TaxID=1815559 RepID=A0ABV7FGW9_9GAMM
MTSKVLIVLESGYRFDTDPSGSPDFTYTTLVNTLTSAGFQITRAHRDNDSTPGVIQSFDFAAPGVNLLQYDVIWLIGLRGRNLSFGASGTFDLSEPEIAAITRFMDAGGGVFATGDHDSLGADMCGRIPRVRAARCWYGAGADATPPDPHSPMPADFPKNFPPFSVARADTTRTNPAGNYSEFAAPFVWFENQSDSVPQVITPVSSPAHPILRNGDRDIEIYPDHMHEGNTLGEVPGYNYNQTLSFDGESFVEFPSMAGEHPKPEVIATGQVLENASRFAGGGTADAAIASSKSVNTLSVYDGRRVGVGRIVTGATFHHYVDINLTGDSGVTPGVRQTRAGADAAKGQGFGFPGAEQTFNDIKAVYINITRWLARPRPAVRLILERSTFGQDEVTVNPEFAGAFLVTVDGLKPGDFPGGGISTLSPSASQLAAWAPAISVAGAPAIEVVPTAIASDDPVLAARLQRFTFTYRVRFVGNAFGFAEPQRTLEVNAALNASSGLLTDTAWIQLVKSANPFMLDLEGGNTTPWLSSDLKVFRVVEGESVHGVTLPNGASRAQALQFINSLTSSITPAQFEALTGNQAASALSLFPLTTSGRRVYNFAVARVRRNGTLLAADDVRLFFRIFTSQTTAALTYREAMGAPLEGYLKTPGANPIALPGQAGGEWLSFPCFAEARAATPAGQQDTNNVKDISTSESNKFFGVLLDNNLTGNYLPSTPAGGAVQSLPDLLMGEHQCLVAQIEFAGTPIPNGANPSTSDKLSQRNIALSEVANPGLAASRVALHTFEIEARPQPISDSLLPDELLLEWSRNLPEGTYVNIEIPSWRAREVVALADRLYPLHNIRALDERTIQMPAGGSRYLPLPRSLHRQTGVISVELPLGIKKGQRFDVAIRQITNRGRDVRFPAPKLREISRKEAEKLIAGLLKTGGDTAKGDSSKVRQLMSAKGGVFDLGDNRSLVTDLSVLDAQGDHAVIIEHPDPKAVEAARREARMWRQTLGAFQLGIPVSVKDEMLLHHLRLLSVMTWRAAKLSRTSRWYASFNRYVELLTDKVRALGGDPFNLPATPDGQIPQLDAKGDQPANPGQGAADNGVGGANQGYLEPGADEWLVDAQGLPAPADAKAGIWSGKVSGLLYDHFGDFEGFTLENYAGNHLRFFSREGAIHDLAQTAWRERYLVTVMSVAANSREVRRLLIRGY